MRQSLIKKKREDGMVEHSQLSSSSEDYAIVQHTQFSSSSEEEDLSNGSIKGCENTESPDLCDCLSDGDFEIETHFDTELLTNEQFFLTEQPIPVENVHGNFDVRKQYKREYEQYLEVTRQFPECNRHNPIAIDEHYEVLIRTALENNFIPLNNPGAGDCLFMAVSVGLRYLKKGQGDGLEIKRRSMAYLKLPETREQLKHKVEHRLEGFISDEAIGVLYDKELYNIEFFNHWPDTFIVQGVAEALNINIRSFLSDHPGYLYYQCPRGVESDTTVTIGNKNQQHFIAFLPKIPTNDINTEMTYEGRDMTVFSM